MLNTRGVSFCNDLNFSTQNVYFIARAVYSIHGPPVFSILVIRELHDAKRAQVAPLALGVK